MSDFTSVRIHAFCGNDVTTKCFKIPKVSLRQLYEDTGLNIIDRKALRLVVGIEVPLETFNKLVVQYETIMDRDMCSCKAGEIDVLYEKEVENDCSCQFTTVVRSRMYIATLIASRLIQIYNDMQNNSFNSLTDRCETPVSLRAPFHGKDVKRVKYDMKIELCFYMGDDIYTTTLYSKPVSPFRFIKDTQVMDWPHISDTVMTKVRVGCELLDDVMIKNYLTLKLDTDRLHMGNTFYCEQEGFDGSTISCELTLKESKIILYRIIKHWLLYMLLKGTPIKAPKDSVVLRSMEIVKFCTVRVFFYEEMKYCIFQSRVCELYGEDVSDVDIGVDVSPYEISTDFHWKFRKMDEEDSCPVNTVRIYNGDNYVQFVGQNKAIKAIELLINHI